MSRSIVQKQHEEMAAMFEVIKRARAVVGWSENPKQAVAMLGQALADLDYLREMQDAPESRGAGGGEKR